MITPGKESRRPLAGEITSTLPIPAFDSPTAVRGLSTSGVF